MASAPPAFNVAVVGYGLSAKVFHIPLILALPEEYKLFGVVQRSPKPDDDASKDHPGIKSWRSVDAVYQDKDVDLVVITTVPSTHFEMCKDALEAGKHVVVEKPFVPTAAEAERLIEVAKAARKTLTVYQNRRWDSDFLTLRKVMADGLLGDIAEFQSHFDRHRPDPPPDTWKSVDAPGHGAVYDLGSHLIDQVYHTFGMPKSVTGFVGNQRRGVEGGAPDSCTVLLHYDQLLATCKAGVVSPEEEQLRFWVRGTSGSFKKVCPTRATRCPRLTRSLISPPSCCPPFPRSPLTPANSSNSTRRSPSSAAACEQQTPASASSPSRTTAR